MKTSSSFKESRTRTMMRKETCRGIPFIEARRSLFSSAPIVLVLVLDPIAEFLLKSSRVHPVVCS
jgi:hypothetical protein